MNPVWAWDYLPQIDLPAMLAYYILVFAQQGFTEFNLKFASDVLWN